MSERTFTLAEATALVPLLRRHTAGLVQVRADLAEASAALRRGEQPDVGGVPEVKALEARLQEAVDWFAEHDLLLRGFAPVTADFPSVMDDEPVMLCWLEGDVALGWYHRPDTGFAGRRPLPATGSWDEGGASG